MVNKSMAKEFGIEAALLLSELITKSQYYDEEWFYETIDEIEEKTTLSYHKQNKNIEILRDAGFIETKLVGVPARLHFKIIENKILNFFNTSFEKIQKLDLEKFENKVSNNSKTINNNISNNNINKNKDNNIDKRKVLPVTSKFIKPSIDEVKQYCEERRNNINPEQFIDFYNSNGWRVGKNSMKDWRAAVRTWERNNFNKPNNYNYGRSKENQLDDFHTKMSTGGFTSTI